MDLTLLNTIFDHPVIDNAQPINVTQLLNSIQLQGHHFTLKYANLNTNTDASVDFTHYEVIINENETLAKQKYRIAQGISMIVAHVIEHQLTDTLSAMETNSKTA